MHHRAFLLAACPLGITPLAAAATSTFTSTATIASTTSKQASVDPEQVHYTDPYLGGSGGEGFLKLTQPTHQSQPSDFFFFLR